MRRVSSTVCGFEGQAKESKRNQFHFVWKMHITDMNKSLYIYNCVFVGIIVKLWYLKNGLLVVVHNFELILNTHSRQLLSDKLCSKLFVSLTWEYEKKNECLCQCFIRAWVRMWRCILYAHIYREFKSLCLMTWYSFEEELCFLKGYFSDNWSEDGKFVEAIMKQTKTKTTTKPGLSLVVFLWLYRFTSLNYHPAAHRHTNF